MSNLINMHNISNMSIVPQCPANTSPSFYNLSLSTKRKGAFMWDAPISLAITPSLLVKRELIVGGGWGLSARWRDAPDSSSRLTSFASGEKAGRFRKVAGVTIVDAGGPCSRWTL